MTKFASIAVMGDIMIDVDLRIPSLESLISTRGSDFPTEIQLTQGGSAANTASWLSLLGDRVALLGAVGEDIAGDSAEKAMLALGVVPLFARDSQTPTGMCIVITEGDGSRTMIPSAGANAKLGLTTLERMWPHVGLNHFHLSAYSLFHQQTGETAIRALEKTRNLGATVSLDPASHALIPRHARAIRQALRLTNVLLSNQEEAEAIYRSTSDVTSKAVPPPEEILPALLTLLDTDSKRDRVVVITLGEAGSMAMSGSGELVIAKSRYVPQIQSTAGAGDAFNAGFIHAWIPNHGDLQSALHGGNSIAARALTRVGASPMSGNS